MDLVTTAYAQGGAMLLCVVLLCVAVMRLWQKLNERETKHDADRSAWADKLEGIVTTNAGVIERVTSRIEAVDASLNRLSAAVAALELSRKQDE
jgi:hypothetical protein